ncbi:hypothetical protein DAMA08_000880 [Martiniozyma asiatica (nom. inval.)]|nr:hypothetical protein DAMA08_000880 [Martiniozyma asiatica]
MAYSGQRKTQAKTSDRRSAVVTNPSQYLHSQQLRNEGGLTDAQIAHILTHPETSRLRLFVGNLSNTTSADLAKTFNNFSSLCKVDVLGSYGFVAFEEESDFIRAFKEMQGALVNGRPLTLKRANNDTTASKKDKKSSKIDKRGSNVNGKKAHTKNKRKVLV